MCHIDRQGVLKQTDHKQNLIFPLAIKLSFFPNLKMTTLMMYIRVGTCFDFDAKSRAYR